MADTWHFPMLNDGPRNAAYDQALGRLVTPGCRVLDIGCGTGLLSVFAARHGAGQVVAVDYNAALCKVAKQVVRSHPDVSKRISVRNVSSLDLDIEPVDLIVCELFDAALLGEQILDTLHHARSNLLKSRGQVIPSQAVITAMPISSPALRWKRSCKPGCVGPFLEEVSLLQDDTYTCETLHAFPHTPLAVAQPVLKLRFLDAFRGTGTTVTFDVIAAGVVDAIAMWFHVELARGTWIDTSPGRGDCAWQQGLFHVPGCVHVEEGDSIDLVCSYVGEDLRFSLRHRPADDGAETSASMTADCNAESLLWGVRWVNAPPAIEKGLRLSESQWAELNDSNWWDAVRSSLKREDVSMIVDLSHSPVPVAAILAAEQSFCVISSAATPLPAEMQPLRDRLGARWTILPGDNTSMLETVMAHRSGQRLESMLEAVMAHRSGQRLEEGGDWSEGLPDLLRRTVALADVVEPSGTLRLSALADLRRLSDLNRLQHDEAAKMAVMPSRLRVWVRLLEAPSIVQQNRLITGRQCGVDVTAMSSLAASVFQDEGLASARVLTDAQVALDLELSSLHDVPEHLVRLQCIESGDLHVAHYWFEATMSGADSMPVSTLERLHGQAGLLVASERLTCGDEVEVYASLSLLSGVLLRM